MINNIKKKIRNVLYYIAKNNVISVLGATVIVVLYVNLNKNHGEWFDITFFSSLVGAMILEVIAQVASNGLMNSLEDSVKLTTDYDELVKRYDFDFFNFDNRNATDKNKKILDKIYKKQENKHTFEFPIECIGYLKDCDMVIKDKGDKYNLPEIIKENYDEIFASHKTSVIFNQLNIRVNRWKIDDNQFIIKTSRTTYFDSMVTNRAMDFRWSNGLSIREVMEYGPIWPSLAESNLSNHLGFNGFVESSDGYIVFVKRGKNLSIGKRTYATSIGASLKTKYALKDGVFDKDGLKVAIMKEIKDELKIEEKMLEPLELKNNLIAAYRDVVEGGKPQLLFWAKSKMSKKEIEDNFKKKRKEKSKTFKIMEDGTRLIWIDKEELKRVSVTPEMMVYEGKVYKMVPSASASVAMYIEYLSMI